MSNVLVPVGSTGVYSDYTKLQAGILDWAQRADLASKVPAFIEMAERSMFRTPLRASETSISGTTSGDTIALPAVLNAIERLELQRDGVKYTLDYTSPNGIEALTVSGGLPSRYTIENGALRLIAAPAGDYTYTIFYLPTPDFLAAGNPSNAILASAPDVYLWGSLVELARFIIDSEQEARFLAAYTAALTSFKSADDRRRLPQSGGLQIKPRNAR